MHETTAVPTKTLLLISLLQGFALLLLHQSIDYEFWPHASPQWLFALYALAMTGPTLCLLGLTEDNTGRLLKWIVSFTGIAGLAAFYIGLQATPVEHIRYSSLLFGLVITISIASFKVLMYSQQFISSKTISYSQLFHWSWRNFLTLSLSMLFALCFWGVLMLWAGLFKAINIHFFHDLFTEKWFYYPAISLAHGFGIVIFRNQAKVIDTIKSLQQALMKFLLVILIFVSVLFLTALPFTGLAPLWDSGGSSLILWMQALMLFFINAVYQDDPKHRPYSLWPHRFIYIGVALLPLYSIISFYGLSLRVEQHGWSVMRCWAFLIWFLLALFPLGYLWGIVRLRDNWLHQLSKVNVAIGLVLLSCMIVVNTPLMDFRKIAVSSQLAMLENGELNINQLDVRYFKNHLAGPGFEALQQLKKEYAGTNPLFVSRVTRVYSSHSDKNIGITLDEFIEQIDVVSGSLPTPLKKRLYEYIQSNQWMLDNTTAFSAMSIDLNKDGKDEYLFFRENPNLNDVQLYALTNGEWAKMNLLGSNYGKFDNETLKMLKNNDFEIQPPRWMELKVNGKRYQVNSVEN